MRRLLILVRAILTILENDRKNQTQRRIGAYAYTDQQVTRRPTPIVAELHVPKAAINRYNADQQAQTELENQQLGIAKRQLLIESATLGLLFVATVGAFANLYFVKRSVDEAASAARAAHASVLVSQMGQRAWVHVVPGNDVLPQSLDGIVELGEIELETLNSGKTPAKNVEVRASFDILPKAVAPPLRLDEYYAHTTMGILFPDRRFTASAARHNRLDNRIVLVTPEERDGLKRGDLYLVVFAEITYEDGFGQHWTRFCAWHAYETGAYNSRACVAYNDVGEGKPSQRQP